MKRFGFRLEKVLKYRQEIEEQRQVTLARAIEGVQAEERVLSRLEEQKRETMEEMRKLGTGQVDVAGLRRESAHLGAVKRDTEETEGRLGAAREESESARERFIEARKGRRTLELLRTQRAAEYEHGVEVEEQKELDEISSRPWQVERPTERSAVGRGRGER